MCLSLILYVIYIFHFVGQSDNPLSLSTIPNDLCFKEKRYPQVPSSHIASKKAAPFIVAHRGDILKYQENSLQAITSVIGKGIDGVEFDVFLTKDKELVVFHDENTYVSISIYLIHSSNFVEIQYHFLDIFSPRVQPVKFRESYSPGKFSIDTK